ncbi:unnamed protein product [Phaedon cochleariae]|uniref:Replication factor C subunit 1 n=1 Tax=Phaedon cochleariae TaxID=80249 RepID=A0A9P0DZ06_PHACE|nr:unnamed protein product [Phaedon cochleariae]
MSKDIRSFFNIVSKKTGSGTTKPAETTGKKPKPKKPLIDSDDEDIIISTPEKTPKSSKRKVHRISSDSEDEKKKKNTPKKSKIKEEKLKPVNIDEIFGNKPIKQSKVEPLPIVEHKEETNKTRKGKKKKKGNPEIGIHGDNEFEQTLLELDDDFLEGNVDILDKTIEEALSKVEKEDPENLSKPVEEEKKLKKRQRDNSQEPQGSTTKKHKLEHTDSGIDPDQEVFEKRRYSAMLYQKYKNRGGPKHHGEKEIPKGKPDCLKNLTFLRTGVLDSLDGEEFDNLVKEHGGRVVHSVSKKVSYLVVGDEPGPSKLDKARGMNIPEINEDGLLDMILEKSGMKPKFSKTISNISSESGIVSEDEVFIPKKVDVPLKKQEEKVEIKVKEKKSKDERTKSDSKKDDNKVKAEERIKKEKKEPNETSSKVEIKVKEKESEDERTKSDSKKDDNKMKAGEHIKKEKKEPHETSLLDEKPMNGHTTKPKKDSKQSISKELMKITKSEDLPQVERTKTVFSDESLSWTEKYKPKDIKSIIGQQGESSNMNKLSKWLKNWYRNQVPEIRKKIPRPSPWAKNDDGAYYKAALLSGPPGVGKTTTATLISQELGFDVVEFNASDTRSKRLLHEEVSQLLSTTTIAGFASGEKTTTKKRVLLMDEVDGMAGNEDRGGMDELINLIKNTSIPIVCMCNDRNHQKMRSLVNYCFDLKFSKPRLEQIRGAMLSICFKENIQIPPNALSEIISSTGCDIRQTLNHLSMWSANDKNMSMETVQKETKNAKKDTVLGPWEVVRLVFTEAEQKNMTLADRSRLFFYDYSLGPLFVQENYLNVTPNCPKKEVMKRVAMAADAISMGDLIDAKIRGSNNWSLLESQAMFASVLPGFHMRGNVTARINFPGWLGKNSSATKHKRMLGELHIHARISTSGSKMAMKLDYLVPLRNAIIMPLKKYGTDGVQQALAVMKAYNLLREDLTNLVELCQWKDAKNPFNDIDAKVKSAFTRAYNKEAPLLPFSSAAGVSKKKSSTEESTLLDEEEEFAESDDEENKDDVTEDAMIKVKTKTEKGKKDAKKPGTSKAKDSSKGKTKKGKGK